MESVVYTESEARMIARKIFLAQEIQNYPEDVWLDIGDNWNLNLWTEEFEGEETAVRATLYPCLLGKTLHEDFVVVV